MADQRFILPEGLRDPENLAKVRKAVTQWSKTVPWSWTSYLAFAKDSQKSQEEKKLKKFFRQILQIQAQNLSAYIAYGQEDSKEIADRASEIFKYILGGHNDKITAIQPDFQVKLTLSEVLEELTGEPCIFTSDQDFLNQFHFNVTVDAYSGSIYEDEENPGQYISIMAYPPPPPFSTATVTKEQLIDWITTSGSGDYLPPSAYFPLSGC